jgi:acetyltransferase-like isoleucine patch superfamily enzyme
MTETQSHNKQDMEKEVLSKQLYQGGNPLTRYREKVLGRNSSFVQLIAFETSQLFLTNLGGGLGYLLRKLSLSSLFQSCGRGFILGRGIILRNPGNISVGNNVAIDDHTLLDGGTGPESIMSIGDRTVISKGSVIQAKHGPLLIGDECDIGAHVILTSISKITLENNVLIAGNCYIGGARYNLDDLDKPIMYQGIYSRGPITIGANTWIGASATILDGVTIGKGCVIGAGSVVTKDLPDYAIAVGSPARVIDSRKKNTAPA